jgi:hypothetical protein
MAKGRKLLPLPPHHTAIERKKSSHVPKARVKALAHYYSLLSMDLGFIP